MVYGLFLFAASTEVVWAHDPGLSSALINVHHGKVEVVLTFARRDAEQLLRQFDEADASSAPVSGRLGQNSLARLVCDGFRIAFDHRAGAVKGLTTRDDDPNNTSIAWTLVCDQFLSLQVASELLQHLPRGHRQYLAIQVESSKPIAERLLSA